MGSCNKSFISQSCCGRSSVSFIIGHIPGHKILVPKMSDSTLLASKKFRNSSKISSNFLTFRQSDFVCHVKSEPYLRVRSHNCSVPKTFLYANICR